MCEAQSLLNADLAYAGRFLDIDDYMLHVCMHLYPEAIEWIEFWCEWYDHNYTEYWITNTDMMDVMTCSYVQSMKQNKHYTLVDNARLWNKQSLNSSMKPRVKTIFNTLDHIYGMYGEYMELLAENNETIEVYE